MVKGNPGRPLFAKHKAACIRGAIYGSIFAALFLACIVLPITYQALRSHGFGYTLVQCGFKSWASVSHFQKSGQEFPNVTAVLHSTKDGTAGWSSTTFPTDKIHGHSYVYYYDMLLKPYVKQQGLSVLEIGVKKGGFTRVLRELFPSDAHIVGLDIDPGVPDFPRDAGVKILAGIDSQDCALVDAALGSLKFDVILDDGNHQDGAVKKTFGCVQRRLQPTGVYILEDIYCIDEKFYNDLGYTVSIHPDLHPIERLQVAYPVESKAKGLLDSMPSARRDADANGERCY